MDAPFALRRLSLEGIPLLLVGIALVLLAGTTGFVVRSATSGSATVARVAAATPRSAVSFDSWVRDDAPQLDRQLVPDDSRPPSNRLVTPHEGR